MSVSAQCRLIGCLTEWEEVTEEHWCNTLLIFDKALWFYDMPVVSTCTWDLILNLIRKTGGELNSQPLGYWGH